MSEQFMTSKSYGFLWNISVDKHLTFPIKGIDGRTMEVDMRCINFENQLNISSYLVSYDSSQDSEICEIKFTLADGTLYCDAFHIDCFTMEKSTLFTHPINPTVQNINSILCEMNIRNNLHDQIMNATETYKKTNNDNELESARASAVSDNNNKLCQVCQDLRKTLLLNKKFSDATIIARGEVFHAHQNILAARSPVFRKMFDVNYKSDIVIRIDDIELAILSQVLNFIYTGEFDDEVLDESAADILIVYEKYALNGNLKEKCEEALARNLTRDTFVEILILADLYHCEILKSKVINFFIRNKKLNLTETLEFKKLKKTHPHLLEEIIYKIL